MLTEIKQIATKMMKFAPWNPKWTTSSCILNNSRELLKFYMGGWPLNRKHICPQSILNFQILSQIILLQLVVLFLCLSPITPQPLQHLSVICSKIHRRIRIRVVLVTLEIRIRTKEVEEMEGDFMVARHIEAALEVVEEVIVVVVVVETVITIFVEV